MANSFGGGFPRTDIQYGHLHYTRETRTLWMYVGDNPQLETCWVAIFSQTPLDVSKLTANQRGSSWIDHNGAVKRWNGSASVDNVDVHIDNIKRKVRPLTFQVYDATAYQNKPDLQALYGIRRARVLFENTFFNGQPDHTALPLQNTVTNIAVSAATEPDDVLIVSDIESYQYYTDDAFGAQQRQNIIQVHNWMFAVKPTMNLGMYAHIPQREYRAFMHTPAGFAGWQARNDLMREVVPSVRFIAPSLYTFYEDRNEWIRYAKLNMAEARRYAGGLPVYPFIWFRYHDSVLPLENAHIPADYWALQLNVLRELADGVIIWAGGKDTVWNETLPWWVATKAFVQYHAVHG